MELYHIADWTKLPVSKNQWNELCSQSDTNTPFQTYEWFSSWWSVFGEGKSLFLIICSENEHIIGIAPLMLVRKLMNNQLSFISDSNSDYCDFIVRKEDKQRFITAVFNYIKEEYFTYTHIFLRNIPEQSQTNKLLKNWLLVNKWYHYTMETLCPTHIFQKTDSVIPRQPSKTLQRHLDYFEKNGILSFVVFDSPDEAHDNLKTLVDQHITRWAAVGKKSLFCDQRYIKFYDELLRQALPNRWLFFSCVRFNDQPIALHFGFDYNSKVIWYKPSFDIMFRKYSPGRVMISYLLEYCIKHNKKELDFTIGDESFKNDYANTIKKNLTFKIYKSKTAYLLSLSAYRFSLMRKNFRKL